MILDATILFIGLFIYLILTNWRSKPQQNIKGHKLIVKVKATGTIIHIGDCFDLTEDLAFGRKDNGLHFHANRARLYWSESEQAFVERI